jgi:hypothetical protein
LYKNNTPYVEFYPTIYFLRVASNGDDTLAATLPYQIPFQTINAAIPYATSGRTIFLYPGTYNETFTLPSGVALRGANTQTTIIQQADVTSDTTLVTLSPNCRIEDVTLNLSSSLDGINLIGVSVQNTACITSKMRTCVLNVNHSGSGNTNVYGIYATGTCNTGVSSSNLVRAATINANSNGTGRVRGIYIDGSVRVATRDTNIFCNGLTNAGGGEVIQSNGVLELRTSTISGTTFDISQSTGSILLGTSDLIHSNANSNSFTVSISPSSILFGIIGNIGNNSTRYLVPSIIPINSLSTTAPVNVPVVRSILFFKLSVTFSGTIPLDGSLTFELYKNNSPTIFTLVLTTGQTSASLETSSILYSPGDEYYAKVVSVGDPSAGTFIATVLTY